ncbi:MAG: sigma-70 family RNA polymerase sigma factor [Cellulosilyticaceae bacterium]
MARINENNFIKYLRKRDECALDYVIDHYSGLIRSIIRKHLGGLGSFEEECMNDVLLAVWNNIESFEDAENSFKNWIAAISKYKSIDYKRKYIRLLQEQNLEEVCGRNSNNIEEGVLQQEICEDIEALLMCLPEGERELLRAHYIDDETVMELAEEIGVKPSAIYNRLSRSRKKLKLLFENYKGEA